MKKKLLVAMMIGAMAFGLIACGGDKKEEAAATETTTEVEDDAEEVVEEDEEEVEEDAEEVVDEEAADDSEGFSLLDVSADMIGAGYYTIDDDKNEMVVSLFTAPDGGKYVSLIEVPAEGQGDVICGLVTEEGVEQTRDDENGVTWTSITFTDVYTGKNCTVVFGDGDDGSCGIANEDFSIAVEGKYLTADETIAYMGAAVAYLQ